MVSKYGEINTLRDFMAYTSKAGDQAKLHEFCVSELPQVDAATLLTE